MEFDMDAASRHELWEAVNRAIEGYYSETSILPVAPLLDEEAIKAFITEFASEEKSPQQVLDHVVKGMRQYAVHTPHPAYFGLFNPRANFPGILADTLISAFNPQLAAWSHSPFAVEVENYLVRLFGIKFGFSPENIDGSFTTGGAEANLTALLCALSRTFVNYDQSGLQNLMEKPVIYCSAESHHSIIKSVRIAGMGSNAVRTIPVTAQLKMDIRYLKEQIARDRQSGYYPLMIIATAGTTGTGVIDPLEEIGLIAAQHELWLHVDAAYGGGLVLSSSFELLRGIERADSITFDAHKLLSAPMGTSMFLTQHKSVLGKTFRITAEYMPKEAADLNIVDPFVHSIQWSRRFNGLKLYLGLMMLGEESYRKTIDRQIALGVLLKKQLSANGWEILNHTELPVICFSKPDLEGLPQIVNVIAERIIKKGNVWLSVYPINGKPAFRACITNYNTTASELDLLISELNAAVEMTLESLV